MTFNKKIPVYVAVVVVVAAIGLLCFASAASMIRLIPISKRFYHVEIRVSFPSILSAASKFPLGFFDSDCDGDGDAGKADLRLRLCVPRSLCVCECGLSRYASFSMPLSLCFSLSSLLMSCR